MTRRTALLVGAIMLVLVASILVPPVKCRTLYCLDHNSDHNIGEQIRHTANIKTS
jgi:hypothetical protein